MQTLNCLFLVVVPLVTTNIHAEIINLICSRETTNMQLQVDTAAKTIDGRFPSEAPLAISDGKFVWADRGAMTGHIYRYELERYTAELSLIEFDTTALKIVSVETYKCTRSKKVF